MSNKAFKPDVFAACAPFFQERGYTYQPILHQFQKDHQKGFTNIILSPTHYEDCTYVECSFGCRINLVEELIRPFSKGINGYKDEANTAITNMAKYLNEPHFRYKIKQPADLETFLEKIQTFFTREGFSFLDDLLDLNCLEQHFNGNLSRPSLMAHNEQLRSFRGLVLACIVQNPRWTEILSAYQVLLRQQGTPLVIMDRFDELSNRIAGFGLN